jgi:hypothetical protein
MSDRTKAEIAKALKELNVESGAMDLALENKDAIDSLGRVLDEQRNLIISLNQSISKINGSISHLASDLDKHISESKKNNIQDNSME